MSSATTQALRTSLLRAASCKRYASSSTSYSASASSSSSSSPSSKLDVRPKAELPADKMRILVDLYHQSKKFITKEKLSKAIDDAFIYARQESQTKLHPETPFTALENEVDYLHRAPKFSQPHSARPISSKKVGMPDMSQDWSFQRGPREAAVMSTLYGVTDGYGEPQYEALVDGYQAVKAEIEEEKAQRGN